MANGFGGLRSWARGGRASGVQNAGAPAPAFQGNPAFQGMQTPAPGPVPAVPDTEVWGDDTPVFHDQGSVMLSECGPQKRPNGETYFPRRIGNYEDVAWMRHCRQERQHILFFGPPGTGKSALSDASFPDGFEMLVCTADTTEADIVGGYIQDPSNPMTFLWANGPFLRSLERGVPFIIEEIALADPRVLSVVYPAMDGRSYVEVPSNPSLGKIPVPTGWNVVASYNPDVPGASMSDALLDRFDHNVEVTTDWDLAAGLGVDASIIRVAQDLDQRRRSGEIGWSPQLRSLLSYRDAAASFGHQYALSNLVSKTPKMYRPVVVSAIERVFPGKAAVRDKNGGSEPILLGLGPRYS